MYLKEITATGFKSFADKINIKLDDKVTCIVGPNGSGKSNIVDAVRWVLGEQSVKQLRGDNTMSDVIFSGSKSRKAYNTASVELTFDNNDHYLPLSFDSVSLKRRAFRSGENEYFINNSRCRLKDIVNLLLDSGMAKESFNIISQGEVQRIIDSNALDRRSIFEEASGILKYKRRKEEALRKLDKTNNNLERVNDIISEVATTLEPLKVQKEEALIYKEKKDTLENLEIALLSYLIKASSTTLDLAKKKKETLEKNLLLLTNNITVDDALITSLNSKIIKLEEKIKIDNQKLVVITKEVEQINSDKLLLQERNKQNIKDNELTIKLRELTEEINKIDSKLSTKELEITNLKETIKDLELQTNTINKDINNNKLQKDRYLNEKDESLRRINTINYKINSLEEELNSNRTTSTTVRKVLENDNLTGIYNTIGNVLDIDVKYAKALDIAISSIKDFVITKDEVSAKIAIKYLKENKLGRATFFPISVIKSRYIDDITLNKLKGNNLFVGVLSDLVTYDTKYDNIIKNQLGTTIVTTDIDSALKLSKLIANRYKIVTLDKDVIHVGGSLSGGSNYSKRSNITIKEEINTNKKNILYEQEKITALEDNINTSIKLIKELENKYFNITKEQVSLNEKLLVYKDNYNKDKDKFDLKKKELSNFKDISNNKFFAKEEELIKKYHDKETTRKNILIDINNNNEKLSKLKEEVLEKSASEKLKNSNIRNIEKELKEEDININRMDVKLDNMLNTLNSEYSLTYEKAYANYHLEIEVKEAEEKVNKLKSTIKSLGMVNLAAIEEFDKVNERYTFLSGQKDDLEKATNTLLEVMDEMDEVMVTSFKETFTKIKEEFKIVFKELFKGGDASLTLTDPSNLLTTGIDIVASPPGKKLTSISLLSGGEKTLTAISLLFAMLNVRSVPFCLFDEVEAALDDANVTTFGKYLKHYANKTQFLIITHKKKTMEYADTLYGITMQESGVSKLVSVRLNEIEEVL